jgi:hypothetical protein
MNGDSEAVYAEDSILSASRFFLDLFMLFPRRASRRLGLKREPRPSARLLPTGEMLAKFALNVLTSKGRLAILFPRLSFGNILA